MGYLVAVLAVAAVVPLVLAAVPRVRVPGPVLEIVAGIVLGPAVLDLVQPDQAVRLVSTIGLAFLLFLAGLAIDVRHFRGPRARLAALTSSMASGDSEPATAGTAAGWTVSAIVTEVWTRDQLAYW